MLKRDFISLGTGLQIEFPGVEERFRSVLIGMEPDNYLVVRTPIAVSEGMARGQLLPGTVLTIRYLFDGAVWGFRSTILQTLTGRIRVMFVSYPDSVENHDLRRSNRIECLVPADADWEGKSFPGMITDMSEQGVRLVFQLERTPGIEDWHPDVGGCLGLSMQLPGSVQAVPAQAELRNFSRDGERLLLGLQFVDLEDPARSLVHKFLEEVRSRLGI
jgi:c-di-GMP-binding flagellar brake protein YcgR